MVFLPEAVDYIAANVEENKKLAETLDGQLVAEYKTLAQVHDIWISVGGIHEIAEKTADTVTCASFINLYIYNQLIIILV